MKKVAAKKAVVGKKTSSAKKAPAKSSGLLSGQDHGVRVGDDVLKQRTGKIWAEWFPISDKAGAKKMNHTEITDVLHEKFGLPVGGARWLRWATSMRADCVNSTKAPQDFRRV